MTDTRNNGGPAFPHDKYMKREDGQFGTFAHGGMSLRDWFAGQALAGEIASTSDETIIIPNGKSAAEALADDAKRRAEWCYLQADAMLTARSPSSKEV